MFAVIILRKTVLLNIVEKKLSTSQLKTASVTCAERNVNAITQSGAVEKDGLVEDMCLLSVSLGKQLYEIY